jgi:hypothetical protein
MLYEFFVQQFYVRNQTFWNINQYLIYSKYMLIVFINNFALVQTLPIGPHLSNFTYQISFVR